MRKDEAWSSTMTNNNTTTINDNGQKFDKEIDDLKQKCYTELCEIVNGIASALDVSASSIMNVVALRTMSHRLPESENDMLKIPHVTKANFDKYGITLLDITKKFAAEKIGICKI